MLERVWQGRCGPECNAKWVPQSCPKDVPKVRCHMGGSETTVARVVLQNYPDITLRGGEKQPVPGRGMAGTEGLDLLVAEETGIG